MSLLPPQMHKPAPKALGLCIAQGNLGWGLSASLSQRSRQATLLLPALPACFLKPRLLLPGTETTRREQESCVSIKLEFTVGA